MRTALGIGVFALGVAGISAYGWHWPAERAEAKIQNAADALTVDTKHHVLATVAGRDITLSGLADSEAERDALLAAYRDATGRRVVRDELDILETQSPFTSEGSKLTDGVMVAGFVPTESLRAALKEAGLSGADDMRLASGSGAHWQGTVTAASSAMGLLESGEWYLTDDILSLQGTAFGPSEMAQVEAALANVPAQVRQDISIDMMDDGSLAAFEVSYDAIGGGSAFGKLPYGTQASDFADALGVANFHTDAKAGLIDNGLKQRALDELGAFRPWLGYFETAKIGWSADDVRFSGELTQGAPEDLIAARLSQELGEGAVQIATADTAFDEGAARVNSATGIAENYFGGFWLPTVSFDPSQAACAENSENALAASKVSFVTGSATLSVDSYRVINRLAAIIRPCVQSTDLEVLLGGHTDAQGDATANLDLSQSRADAVRTALIQRGVPEASIVAVGYGESLPIADNETEEGRAANRRTTIEWRSPQSEPAPVAEELTETDATVTEEPTLTTNE